MQELLQVEVNGNHTPLSVSHNLKRVTEFELKNSNVVSCVGNWQLKNSAVLHISPLAPTFEELVKCSTCSSIGVAG